MFRVGDSLYGCALRDAQEIIPARHVTRIPGAPAYVRGLINVRGAIVTVLDLGRRLDPARAATADGFVVLAPHRGRLVGIAVDEVVDVAMLTEDPIPGGVMEQGIIRGIGRAGETDVILIDLELLIDHALL